jgi:crotonobetainyl-CoA:carnitine CoA-transferase CaiB-like acyl-CoA transferase
MDKVLDGIRVLDWTVFQQGPVSTMLLGDMGADVIKIEERVGGDMARGMMRIGGAIATTQYGQRNVYFEMANRNKRSITLDLSKEKGSEILCQLVAKSDVFVHNFRTDTVQKLGLGYATLSKYNPRLIYAGCSGWGPKGPDRDAPAFDFAAMARSGFLNMVTEPGRQPWFPQSGIADQMGAITTALGVVSALLTRERTGVGQEVSTSILGGISFVLHMGLGFSTMAGISTQWIRREKTGNPLYNYYLCSDKRWITLVNLTPDPRWPALCRAMGLEHLEKDHRFDSMDHRQANCEQLINILDEKFAIKPSHEWTKIFREHDLIFSVVNTIDEFGNDPQPLANGYLIEYDHPMWGKTRMPGFPIDFNETPWSISRPAPELGQHTEEILMDILGYTWEDIAILKDEQVI